MQSLQFSPPYFEFSRWPSVQPRCRDDGLHRTSSSTLANSHTLAFSSIQSFKSFVGRFLPLFQNSRRCARNRKNVHLVRAVQTESAVFEGPRVEKGKYPYHVESAINVLLMLPSRGSIAKAMQPFQNELQPSDWGLIFKELQVQREWQRAGRLFKWMQRQDWCQPGEHIYTLMISIYGNEGMLDKAYELFSDDMPQLGVEHTVYTFTALINVFGKNGKYEKCLDLLKEMKEEGVQPNIVTYNTVINHCAKCGYEWEGLLHLFGQLRKDRIQPDLITYNTLIAACADRGLADEAAAVFTTMTNAGCEPDTITYTSMIDTFGNKGRLQEVQQLLKDMEKTGNTPDVVAYNVLINAYKKSGKYKEAAAVFQQMKRAGATPDVLTYSTLLDTLGKHGCYDDVRALFEEMKANNCPPNTITYNTIIDTFGEGGFYQEAVDLFDDMRETGVDPDAITFKLLLQACGSGGLFKEAAGLRQVMQTEGLVPSTEMYTSMIEAYGRASLYEDAVGLFNWMGQDGVARDKGTYSAVLAMFGKAGLCEQAKEVFSLMEKIGHTPENPDHNALIEAYAKGGLYEEALSAYADMRERQLQPDGVTHSCIMAAVAGAGALEEGFKEYRDLKDEGYYAEAAGFCSLVSLCAKNGAWKRLGEVLAEMGHSRMPEYFQVLAGMLVGEYDGGDDWKEVESTLDGLRVEGLIWNLALYNAAVDALWFMGQKERAWRLFQCGQERGAFPHCIRKSRTIWAVDVHSMSVGAALTVLYGWLKELRAATAGGDSNNGAKEGGGQGLQQLLSITVWMGRQKVTERAVPPVKAAVGGALEALGSAPFVTAAWNGGRLVAQGPPVAKWLSSSKVSKQLVLTNSPLPDSVYPKAES